MCKENLAEIISQSLVKIFALLEWESPSVVRSAGLPDGLFSNQKSQFWYNLEGLGMENVVIFYDHLEYFMAIFII
jgi:hypothetical protein